MAKQFEDDGVVTLKFGGGIHSRASEDEIDNRECKEGQNFLLDLQNTEFRNRPPFDLIGTAPNGQEIRGFVSLLKSDGSVSALVQAASDVYEIDSNHNFSLVGTVSSTAKLRGRIEHNWQLDDKVIITDINLQQPVMEWDGTTFSTITFTKENDTSFGTFRSKYCFVSNERAVFANVHSNGTNTPHLIVGSERGNYDKISIAQRPSSSLTALDPFFLIQPDYRAINGLVEAYGDVVTSSFKGSLFKLTGDDATDFAFKELHAGSGASGFESLVYAGNDTFYGRQGRIESVLRTDKFADVETDDLSKDIADSIDGYDEWISVYNSRTQLVYFFPEGQSEVWVLNKPLLVPLSVSGQIQPGISPWSKYVTLHESAFQPTAVMNMYDPNDSLEYVFFGDSSGNVYKMEGTGSGDAGSNNINVSRLSKLISAPADGTIFSVEGYVKHRKGEAATLTIRFEYAGESVFNEALTVSLPAVTGATYYSNSAYYTNGSYYGTPFKGKLRREKFAPAGASNEFQIRTTVEGTTDFQINEIGLRFKVSSP